jgi:hypothetical protein
MSKQAAPRTGQQRPGFSVTITASMGDSLFRPGKQSCRFSPHRPQQTREGANLLRPRRKASSCRRETIRAFGDAASRRLQVENEDGKLYLIYFVRVLSILRETAVPA